MGCCLARSSTNSHEKEVHGQIFTSAAISNDLPSSSLLPIPVIPVSCKNHAIDQEALSQIEQLLTNLSNDAKSINTSVVQGSCSIISLYLYHFDKLSSVYDFNIESRKLELRTTCNTNGSNNGVDDDTEQLFQEASNLFQIRRNVFKSIETLGPLLSTTSNIENASGGGVNSNPSAGGRSRSNSLTLGSNSTLAADPGSCPPCSSFYPLAAESVAARKRTGLFSVKEVPLIVPLLLRSRKIADGNLAAVTRVLVQPPNPDQSVTMVLEFIQAHGDHIDNGDGDDDESSWGSDFDEEDPLLSTRRPIAHPIEFHSILKDLMMSIGETISVPPADERKNSTVNSNISPKVQLIKVAELNDYMERTKNAFVSLFYSSISKLQHNIRRTSIFTIN